MVLQQINYIIDTSVLLNFVATGQAKLLIKFLQEPIAITHCASRVLGNQKQATIDFHDN